MNDVTIVGAGPAGAYLGYCLAKAGVKVTIFDHSHPREKPCGGGITAQAIERFPILSHYPGPKVIENRGRLISPNGSSVKLEGNPPGWGVSRLNLDKFLLEKAAQHGAVHIKQRVIQIKPDKFCWAIKTKGGTHHSRILAGADGVHSIVRKTLVGPIQKEHLGICTGCFANKPQRNETTIKFFSGLDGYGWNFPRPDHVSIGVGASYKHAGSIMETFKQFLSDHHAGIKMLSSWGGVIPRVSDPEFFNLPTCGSNWLLVGDAAGHVDPINGEGITYALWSAELASRAIGQDNILNYQDLWRKEYGNRLIQNTVLKNVFYNESLIDKAVEMAKSSKQISDFFYNILNGIEDYARFLNKLI
jgi:geranylgeranyl reductase family protein